MSTGKHVHQMTNEIERWSTGLSGDFNKPTDGRPTIYKLRSTSIVYISVDMRRPRGRRNVVEFFRH